ncbi:Pr6Pr family membrane protein [Streptomyces leeuwenhoekii]|uniref:Integral Membrane Regulator n=1 Tax=Streptomyces leeuwenhoekii TaxID=1437453 RepID=A0A0F7W193_STRLW|nr:Pr6Pr family membrane protein [Streptomyces leeuwenhoekii]CQR62761.1 Integral Membrane Regulator [Streptomyces leeuwenhoekii]
MTAPIPRDIPDLPAVPGMPKLLSSPVPAAAVVAPARRPLAAAFRLLTALLAATGVTIACLQGDPSRALSHFTVQSNILLVLALTLAARRAWTARRPLPTALTGATLLYVLVAGLVHHLLLADAAGPSFLTGGAATGWQSAADHILHTATPIAAVLDWLLLTTPGHLRLRQAAPWLLYPLAYLAFSLAHNEIFATGTAARPLYPFLDTTRHGYRSVLGNALLLGLATYALAVLLVALDHLRPDPTPRRPKTGFRLQPPVG